MKRKIIDVLMVATLVGACSSQAFAVPTALPDAGSSALLLGGAFATLTFVRRFFR